MDMTFVHGKLLGCSYLLEGDGGFNPLKLDEWSLWFWTLVAFLVLLVLLTRFAWRPLMETVKNREERIAGDLAAAEEARKEAEATRQKHREEMEQAAQEVKGLLDEARERADKLRVELEAEAREEAQGLVERARKTIEAEKQQALREIKDQVVDLSVAISARVAEGSPDKGDHSRQAEELIAKLKESW